jgi:hypothetical protein
MQINFTYSGVDYTLDLQTKDTREGFKHVATLSNGKQVVARATQHWCNRTWEAFPYDSVKRMVSIKYFGFNVFSK